MTGPLRLVGLAAAGWAAGALLGILLGGAALFGRAVVEDLRRPEGGFSIVAMHGGRLAAYAAVLFGLPAGLGGAAATLVAFRPGRRPGGPRASAIAPALVGLLVAAAAAPVGFAVHAAAIVGPGWASSGLPLDLVPKEVLICGAAGLLAGLGLGVAAGRRRPGAGTPP